MIPGLPPTKVAGLLHVVFGFMALTMATFFVALPGSFGVETNWRMGICGLLAVYGLYRVVTGILEFRKAGRVEGAPSSPAEQTVPSGSRQRSE